MESRAETMDAAETPYHSGLKVIAGVPARNVAPVIFNTIGAGTPVSLVKQKKELWNSGGLP